ncbi:DNA/RNA non-specific endonuclease [Neisseria sp. Ec49-e6-T10]|uniref:DNA/RNA non-specific endonuclease n=1 Tax=Neisseria sp. Ec49-e6-T10 TaxID=3140744 RepID=UPI003EB9C130
MDEEFQLSLNQSFADQQRLQREQEEQLQRQKEALELAQQKAPELNETVKNAFDQSTFTHHLDKLNPEQKEAVFDGLAQDVALKSGRKENIDIELMYYSPQTGCLMANIGNNKYAFVNVEETLAKHGLSVDKELLQAKAPEKAPEKLNKEQELISEHFNRSYPPKGRLKEIVQQMNNHQVDKQLSEFTPKEQYILKEAVGFVTHDYAGDPPKINQLQINQEEIQLNLGKQNEQFNLSTPKIIAGEPLEDSIKKPVETQLEPENTEHKIIAQKGDTGWSLAQKLDSEHPYEALGVLYRSGQIKDIKLKDGNQHIIPNIQPNKEYTYDRSQYTEEQQAKNEQAGRQIVTGQSLANEHIDLARAQALEEQRERNPNLQQQTQITQLFQNINNQVANNPNMANGLSKQELESVIKEQLSRYQEHSLINKGVSVAAMHKFSQSETLQAAVNRSDKSINTVEALQWVNNTAQNVPLSNIRPLTAQPSVMPIMKMTNYEGKPLTEVEQAAYSKGANESMLSGLKEMVNDANLLSKDILNTVGYSLLGGLYDQTAASESIHRNNERINSLFNSVGFLAGSATGQTMYYSAHPDELIKGVNGMLVDRQEQVQQLKKTGDYYQLGINDGKIGFEVLSAVAPIGMTKNAKNISKAADVLHDTNNTINLERKLGKAEIAVKADIIRDGSHLTEGKLVPNVRYKSGEFEYLYKTDELGRIREFKTDALQLTERTERVPHNSNTLGKLEGDHAGHLAGDRFGGSPELDNLVSQLSEVNLSSYKRLENLWAKALQEGKEVSVSVKINYDGASVRPSGFDVKYKIDNRDIIKISIDNN